MWKGCRPTNWPAFLQNRGETMNLRPDMPGRTMNRRTGMAKKTALVTGAHGTIGRHVATTLAADGWNVLGLGHGRWSADEAARHGVSNWLEGDVTLAALVALPRQPDIIIHCAGSGAVGASITAPHNDFQRTVATTAAVLEYMRTTAPQTRLVYPSSAAVYGLVDTFPMHEGLPLRPVSPYGVHKKIAEEMVVEHSRLFGLNAAVVRLYSIYGEGFRKQLLWDACRRIVADESEFFGTGDETRDWLHVADASQLLMRAASHASSACPVVNGAYGDRVSVRDVVDELFRLLGRHDGPRFCGTVRAGDPAHYHADMQRAHAWGWRPEVSWREGLARYAAWFCREHDRA